MLNLKYGNKKLAIPQMWSEIKLSQWMELAACGDDQDRIISVVTGLSTEDLGRLSIKSGNIITAALSFMLKPYNVDEWLMPCSISVNGLKVDPRIDIKMFEYGQKIILSDAVDGDGPFINNVLTIIEIYLQTIISKKQYDLDLTEPTKSMLMRDISLCDAYAIARNYSHQLNDILKNEAKELNKPPTKEQIAAGLSMYDRFGVMNTIRMLAGGDLLKVDEVLKKDYNTVYSWLLMNKTDAVYNERYAEIINKKK